MNSNIHLDRTLSVTRTYRATPALLLEMWSDPEHLRNWWGPFGFSTTTHAMSFRPGGAWQYTMHGPDGKDWPNYIRYTSISPSGITYEHGTDESNFVFSVAVSFVESEPGTTIMEMSLTFPSADALKQALKGSGAKNGLFETTTRLDISLAELQATKEPYRMQICLPSDLEIQTIRCLRAPRALVFEAFTTAKHIQNWQGPAIFKSTECVFEAREGGKWHNVCQSPDGHVFRYGGEVLEFDPPSRMVSTFVMEGFECFPQTNTTTFTETDGITTVSIRSLMPTKEARDGMLASGMEGGMNEGYERLDALLASDLK